MGTPCPALVYMWVSVCDVVCATQVFKQHSVCLDMRRVCVCGALDLRHTLCVP